jgi:hypothetical protein
VKPDRPGSHQIALSRLAAGASQTPAATSVTDDPTEAAINNSNSAHRQNNVRKLNLTRQDSGIIEQGDYGILDLDQPVL